MRPLPRSKRRQLVIQAAASRFADHRRRSPAPSHL